MNTVEVGGWNDCKKKKKVLEVKSIAKTKMNPHMYNTHLLTEVRLKGPTLRIGRIDVPHVPEMLTVNTAKKTRNWPAAPCRGGCSRTDRLRPRLRPTVAALPSSQRQHVPVSFKVESVRQWDAKVRQGGRQGRAYSRSIWVV
jgi:hypothetical protein